MSTVQMVWDAVAVIACFTGCVFIYTRRHMLSGALTKWHSASGLVQLALVIQSGYLALSAISILLGEHATQRETGYYLISAIVAVIFTVNLDKTGRVTRAD